MLEQGLIQVYTGDGKGKTTASLGLALRAAGHQFKTLIIQFLKGSSYAGELFAVERLWPLIKIKQFGRGCPHGSLIRQGLYQCNGCGQCFLRGKKPDQEIIDITNLAWNEAKNAIEQGEYDLVILDEIGNGFRYNLLPLADVLEVLLQKPEQVEIVLTGRGIPQEIMDIAHLVTEVKMVKHPYQQGIKSRRGIEY
jgi:cob(I)alamin adenosyltransferase